MDFYSKGTSTAVGPAAMRTTVIPLVATLLNSKGTPSPVDLGLTTLAVAVVTFLASAFWKPRVHKQAPKLTSDTTLLISLLGFVRQWQVVLCMVNTSAAGANNQPQVVLAGCC